MPIISELKEMDKKFSWSFLGFLMAIIFGLLSIYLGFFKHDNPALQLVITSNSNVLDIKERLGSLDVLYEGESLSKTSKDLRIITFQVTNPGSAPILPNYYDLQNPVGFTVVNGVLADTPSVVKASNKYLEKNITMSKRTPQSVAFSNIILEPGDSFFIRLLVLYEIGKEPSIEAFGKIANIKEIEVIQDRLAEEERGILEASFTGGIASQFIRLGGYGFLFFFSLILTTMILSGISELNKKKRREKLISAFKDFDSSKITEQDSYIFDRYRKKGITPLMEIHTLVSNQRKMNTIYRWHANTGKRDRFISELDIIDELKIAGVLIETDGTLAIDQERLVVIKDFLAYLKRKGETKEHSILLRDFEETTIEEKIHTEHGSPHRNRKKETEDSFI